MDPKEQLRQVEEEMARDEAEAKRLSQTDAAGSSNHQLGDRYRAEDQVVQASAKARGVSIG